ncbi:MAG: type II secretion system F family protein [Delftia sp.]|nr:type II secretion system F family protein [Delftia sp.]
MGANTFHLTLSILGGLGFLSMWWSLTTRRRSVRRVQETAWLDGVQARLDRARLDAEAGAFLTRSALVGGAMGLAAALIVNTPVVFPVFFAGGFVLLWSRLEDRRNGQINQYNTDLAWAMDIMLNAWRIQPSMQNAFQAVVDYGPGSDALRSAHAGGNLPPASVAADFDDVLYRIRQGTPLAEALQTVADHRQSLTFDALATALIVADEQSGEVAAMLSRQTTATREQAATFDEAITKQRNKRREIRNGTFGPWLVLALTRVLSWMSGATYGVEFFHTPLGAVTALIAAGVTILVYTMGLRIAARGLILGRIGTEG